MKSKGDRIRYVFTLKVLKAMAHILSSLVLGELQQMSGERHSDASTWNEVELVPRTTEFQRYMVLFVKNELISL